MDSLVGLGYLIEERTEFSGLLQYTYRLTTSGKKFAREQLESIERDDPELYSILTSAIERLKDTSTPDLVDWSKEVTAYMYE